MSQIAPEQPGAGGMRAKFLDEHFHKEDEVRLFVWLRSVHTCMSTARYEVLCEAGD